MNGPSIRRRLVRAEHPVVPGATNSGTIRTCRSAVRSIPPSRAPPSAACGPVSSTSCSTTRRCWRGCASPTGRRTTRPISSCCRLDSASSCSRSRAAACGWRTGNGASLARGSDVSIDPVRQARQARYALRAYVEGDARWPSSHRRVRWAHAVVLPHTEIGDDFAMPDCPRWMVIDRTEMDSIGNRARAILRDQDNDLRALTTADVDLIQDILAGRGRAQRDLLAEAQDRDEGVRRLTEDQALILGAVQLLNRVEVRGGAGSGERPGWPWNRPGGLPRPAGELRSCATPAAWRSSCAERWRHCRSRNDRPTSVSSTDSAIPGVLLRDPTTTATTGSTGFRPRWSTWHGIGRPANCSTRS